MGWRVLARGAPIADALWPAPARLGARPGERLLGDYLVVPDAEHPRFLLPRRRRAAVRVLRHFRSDGPPRVRRRIAALGALVWVTRGWPLTRGRLTVSWPGPGEPDTIETHLREVLGHEVSLGIHLGPPRANRKPILQVLGPDDLPAAFGKLGVDPLTRRLVRAETAALAALAGLELPGVRIPRLLHHGRWREVSLVVMTPLPLRDAASTVTTDRRVAAMVAVARVAGTESSSPARSGCLAGLRERAEALDHAEIRDHVLGTLDRLVQVQQDWEFGSWHGDWTVWNMAGLGDEVLLWDWERFATGVPLGWDALHYALRQEFATRAPTSAVARDLIERAPGLLAPFGVPAEHAAGVTYAYLVELALRYTADGQREAGGRTARVEEWLLPVLPREDDP